MLWMDERGNYRLDYRQVRQHSIPSGIGFYFFCDFRLLGDIPNTYAFTKALGEALVVEQMDNLPVIIARPSIGKSGIPTGGLL